MTKYLNKLIPYLAGCLALCLLMVGLWVKRPPDTAQANQGDLDAVRATYSSMAGTALDSCALCHTASFGKNSYGQAYKNAGRNLGAIENQDSDGDGFTNIEEILALTFPGDASSKPAQLPPSPGSVVVEVAGPSHVSVGQEFEVSVVAQGVETAQAVYGAQFELNYDPTMLEAVSDSLRPASAMSPYLVVHSQVDRSRGKIAMAFSRQGDVPGLSGNVTLATVRLRAICTKTPPPTNLAAAFSIADREEEDEDEDREDIGDGDDRDDDDDDDDDDDSSGGDDTTFSLWFQPDSLILGTKEAGVIAASMGRPLNITLGDGGILGQANVIGQVYLGSNTSGAGAIVEIENSSWSAATDSSGTFNISNVTSGNYRFKADAPLHLSATCHNKQIEAPLTQLAPVTLPGGDLNDDDIIDISDATAIGVHFGTVSPGTDINQDGVVNVLDLIILANNYQVSNPVWDC